MRQLPVLPPSIIEIQAPWQNATSLRQWIVKRALELIYTAWDLQSLAADTNSNGPPFRWNPARRFLLRCELDAAFFHLYGISRDDVDYIMDTFHIIRGDDEAAFHEYRTKRVILEIYDRMQHAIASGEPYETELEPPPADPSLCHPKKKVGILAFGSLIHDPREELRSKTTMRIKTTTPFPVEYGRYSGKTRGGAPTLVPHRQGAPVAAEILVMDDDVTVDQAMDILWRRETGKVGSGETYKRGAGLNAVLVETYGSDPCVESVLYTDFHADGKIASPTAGELAEHAIDSVATAPDGKDGISYLANNIAHAIQTPLTDAYRAEILRQTGTSSLTEALLRAKEVAERAHGAAAHE